MIHFQRQLAARDHECVCERETPRIRPTENAKIAESDEWKFHDRTLDSLLSKLFLAHERRSRPKLRLTGWPDINEGIFII